ncbi:hypothetical protein JOC94_000132 [Bacillus thermophilus]|uniref:Uncharacterized protein n=1 Tax=Siminovitchia thermophila TaxID=1245522 RepID=A0ABS2R0J4_9BACI|nr:hypothetical protein [Siminovitchia thermophila]
MLVELIGHLGAVISHMDLLYSLKILKVGVLRHLTCGIK